MHSLCSSTYLLCCVELKAGVLLGAEGSSVPSPQTKTRCPFTALPFQLWSPQPSSCLTALEGYTFCGSFASVDAIFDHTGKY